MADTPTTTLTPARLWKRMTPEQRMDAARAFWRDEQATDDQVQAVMLIAQQKKFRPKTIIGLDEERKARHLATLPNLPEQLAARALVVYHLAERRDLMGDFLNALGISHENGVIQEDEVKPDPSKIPSAVDQLLQKFPREQVWLYLHTLLAQDPATWGEIEKSLPKVETPAS